MRLHVRLIGAPFFFGQFFDWRPQFQPRLAPYFVQRQWRLHVFAVLGPCEAMLRVGLPEPVRRGLRERLETLLAFLQVLSRTFVRPDVFGEASQKGAENPEGTKTHQADNHQSRNYQHLQYEASTRLIGPLVKRSDLVQALYQARIGRGENRVVI